MKESRQFWNGRTGRNEVWLEWISGSWHVYELDGNGVNYPDTDAGCAAAAADYERRVAERCGR